MICNSMSYALEQPPLSLYAGPKSTCPCCPDLPTSHQYLIQARYKASAGQTPFNLSCNVVKKKNTCTVSEVDINVKISCSPLGFTNLPNLPIYTLQCSGFQHPNTVQAKLNNLPRSYRSTTNPVSFKFRAICSLGIRHHETNILKISQLLSIL